MNLINEMGRKPNLPLAADLVIFRSMFSTAIVLQSMPVDSNDFLLL